MAGLPALKLRSDITAAANVRAREIKQSFSHTRPDGSSFSTALKEQGGILPIQWRKHCLGAEDSGTSYERMDEQRGPSREYSEFEF